MVFFTRKSSHISDCRNNVCCQCKSNEINHYKVRPPKVISCLVKMHTFKNLAYLSIFVMFLFFPFNKQLFFFIFLITFIVTLIIITNKESKCINLKDFLAPKFTAFLNQKGTLIVMRLFYNYHACVVWRIPNARLDASIFFKMFYLCSHVQNFTSTQFLFHGEHSFSSVQSEIKSKLFKYKKI